MLGRRLASLSGETVGKVDDVIVRLRSGNYPLISGLVGKVGGRRVYIPIKRVAELSELGTVLSRAKVDLRSFERRDGEVLLREDILGHRLIDVADAELVRAWDIESSDRRRLDPLLPGHAPAGPPVRPDPQEQGSPL